MDIMMINIILIVNNVIIHVLLVNMKAIIVLHVLYIEIFLIHVNVQMAISKILLNNVNHAIINAKIVILVLTPVFSVRELIETWIIFVGNYLLSYYFF